jgi:hypothetical protein
MQIVAKVRRGTKLTPLEVMLHGMYEAHDSGNKELALAYAEKAAPYIHPKLQAISQELSADVNIGSVDAPIKEGREEWLAKRAAALTVIGGAKTG